MWRNKKGKVKINKRQVKTNIRLAKKFIWAFLYYLTENLSDFFGNAVVQEETNTDIRYLHFLE